MYVELHCHSAFSFLDGASLPDELAPAALELGHQALALTDHNTVSGSMEFAVAARALGLRPIHGAEVDLSDGRHLTLLVQGACPYAREAGTAFAAVRGAVGRARPRRGPGLSERVRASGGTRRVHAQAAARRVRV
jgi:error-prone DNA polymerase